MENVDVATLVFEACCMTQIVTEAGSEALPKCWHVREFEHAVKK